jgi:hypothetical protein
MRAGWTRPNIRCDVDDDDLGARRTGKISVASDRLDRHRGAMDDELPWPSKGETLFKGDAPDWPNNACINFDPEAWWGYAEGFRLGADYLVERIEQTSADQDFLVYPVVFGYRHAVELRLKVIIRDARRLLREPGGAPKGHKLDRLWTTLRPLLEQAFPNESKDDLDAADEAITQLHKADPASTGFRYPEDTAGGPSLAHLGLRINLRHLRDRMAGLFTFLDAVVSAIDHATELRDDYEAAMRDAAEN